MSQHQLQKPNFWRSSIRDKPQHHCALHLKNLYINNPHHQHQLTIPLPYALSTPMTNKNIKAMDMILYWAKDWIRQVNFFIYWIQDKTDKLDYFTKHHPSSHHTVMRHEYLQKANHSLSFVPLWGCINHILGLNSPNMSNELRGPKYNFQEP